MTHRRVEWDAVPDSVKFALLQAHLVIKRDWPQLIGAQITFDILDGEVPPTVDVNER
jgi:hypothetical protein